MIVLLRKNLYDLCNFLNSPYTKINSTSKISDFIYEDILILLQKKIEFKTIWNKKNSFVIDDFKFYFKYNILEQNSNLIKLKLSITTSFIMNPSINKINSLKTDDYIIIAEYSYNKLIKIFALISKEEDMFIYTFLYNKNLETLNNIIPLKLGDLWSPNLTLINNKIQSLSYHSSTRKVKEISKFNIEAACNYAEKFALNDNPEYISFEKSGGDCTNFASQILHAGGLNKTYTWTPYSNTWLRVEELYSYLIYNKLAYKIPNDSYLNPGTLIQFKTPKLGRFFHTGFITHKLSNGECLYCCHSYNKLNYPLKLIYPVLYPELRGLHFY